MEITPRLAQAFDNDLDHGDTKQPARQPRPSFLFSLQPLGRTARVLGRLNLEEPTADGKPKETPKPAATAEVVKRFVLANFAAGGGG